MSIVLLLRNSNTEGKVLARDLRHMGSASEVTGESSPYWALFGIQNRSRGLCYISSWMQRSLDFNLLVSWVQLQPLRHKPEYYENLCNKRKPVINKTSVSIELPSSILVFHAWALLVQHCYPQKYCQVYTVMDF